jgi:uncharacterized membrane protein YcjF (UPF0283 family)
MGGAVFSVVFGGVGTIIVVGVMALWLPELRRLGRLEAVKTDADEAKLEAEIESEEEAKSPA